MKEYESKDRAPAPPAQSLLTGREQRKRWQEKKTVEWRIELGQVWARHLAIGQGGDTLVHKDSATPMWQSHNPHRASRNVFHFPFQCRLSGGYNWQQELNSSYTIRPWRKLEVDLFLEQR